MFCLVKTVLQFCGCGTVKGYGLQHGKSLVTRWLRPPGRERAERCERAGRYSADLVRVRARVSISISVLMAPGKR